MSTIELLTIPEVATLLKVTTQRAHQMARNGTLPVIRLGRQVRVSPDQLKDWIDGGGRALPGGWRRNSD
jgi:excisionase family DNA binding protein